MKVILLYVGMVLIVYSLCYLFKKHTKFNKKASMILMTSGVFSLIFHSVSLKTLNTAVLYYILQTLAVGIIIIGKIVPYMFIREKAEEDEDI